MDTSKLKPFAQDARRILKAQVSARLDQVLAEQSAARREQPKAVSDLETEIAKSDRDQVIEKVAYTWFNRFTALRFMDANGYTRIKVVSPAEGQTRPEILAESAAGNIDEDAPADVRTKVAALLDGRTPSRDPQGEAYRLLLVAACNQWHAIMPFMFEKITDYTELLMPENLLSADSILAKARTVMTEEACQDVEVIGWLYQFYISEKKDEVFAGLKKSKKITAENIPAATQLFTPHWIVRYLVENSLGRLWLLNRPHSNLAAHMDYYIAPEEPETDFLKISKPEEIKICDPACGSGHMLTYAFDLLYAIYEEEGYEATEIPGLILTYNLYGVEIDDRAGALAAFALAMKAAARLGRRRFMRMDAAPNICVLQSMTVNTTEMQDVASVVGRDLYTLGLRETLSQFEQAKNLGSLIVPKLTNPAEALPAVQARDFGSDLLLRDVQARVVAVLRMADALSSKYHIVVANPPYMGGKGMNPNLQDFARAQYPDSKSDLFAMFMERAIQMSVKLGMMAMINMQSWMFLSSFEKLRQKLISNCTILTMAHLGERGFDTIGGAVVSTTAFIVQNAHSPSLKGEYIRLVDGNSETQKSAWAVEAIKNRNSSRYFKACAQDFEKIPGHPIAYWVSDAAAKCFEKGTNIHAVAQPRHGMSTGNNDLYLRLWQEVSSDNVFLNAKNPEEAKNSAKKWFPVTKGGKYRKWYGNNEYFINYRYGGRDMIAAAEAGKNPGFRHDNANFYFKEGITWSTISSSALSMRYFENGFVIESKGSACYTDVQEDLYEVLSYCNSKIVNHLLMALSPTLDFHEGPLGRVAFINQNNPQILDLGRRAVALARFDWDSSETSWNFQTLPLLSTDYRDVTLELTYTRLRAQWLSISDEMQRLEEENNRIFIDAYGLQGELTPDVPIEEITLTCNPAYRYGLKSSVEDREARLRADTVAEFLSYAVGCMFGRYALDTAGLILANQGEGLADYLVRVPNPSFMADKDNVIPVLDGDWFADDITERFRQFLRVTFGDEKFQENLSFIEAALGKDVRKWFTKDFFDFHVRRYKKRPVYWMFSSPKGSFQVLIYMHRYQPDRKRGAE
jgi:type II restriction/modification system DNA methylase subunit YeeA